jgi:hypothetical protein
MEQEQYMTLDTGREVKLTLRSRDTDVADLVDVDFDILIKDPKDEDFHLPIENTHPKYWKLKGMAPEKSRLMQIRYSGIQEKQIRKAIKRFKETLAESF